MSFGGDRAKNILTNAGNKRSFLAYFEPSSLIHHAFLWQTYMAVQADTTG
jgi:hypothetical protein